MIKNSEDKLMFQLMNSLVGYTLRLHFTKTDDFDISIRYLYFKAFLEAG